VSVIFDQAVDLYRVVRSDFELYRTAQYEAAEQATRGNLLNREAKAAGVDSWSLFIGPNVRAYRWASEELVEWWRTHPRTTFAEFEAQVLAGETYEEKQA
jgi:hypothetical protein